MRFECVIFDLDGTLLDTIDDLTNSINYALNKFGLATHSPKQCLKMIGNGKENFVKKALPADKLHLAEKLLEIAWGHYYDNALIETRIYPEMLETLEKLADYGVKMAVLTNKDQKTAKMIVDHYFCDRFFDSVTGAVNDIAPKPEPEKILNLINKMGFSAEKTLMVGDSEADIAVGKNADVTVAAVSWGFRDKDTLEALSPDYLIDSPRQLLEIIDFEDAESSKRAG